MYKPIWKLPFSATRVGSVLQDMEQLVWNTYRQTEKGTAYLQKQFRIGESIPKKVIFQEGAIWGSSPGSKGNQLCWLQKGRGKKTTREVKLWPFLSPGDRVLWLGTVLSHMKGVGKCWSVGYTHISGFKNSLRTEPWLQSWGSSQANATRRGRAPGQSHLAKAPGPRDSPRIPAWLPSDGNLSSELKTGAVLVSEAFSNYLIQPIQPCAGFVNSMKPHTNYTDTKNNIAQAALCCALQVCSVYNSVYCPHLPTLLRLQHEM